MEKRKINGLVLKTSGDEVELIAVIHLKEKRTRKGQVSTEMLIIIGLVLIIFIPLLALVYGRTVEANNQVASYQAELAVSRIAYLANSVGSLGTSSTIYTDVYFPKNMRSFRVSNLGDASELILKFVPDDKQTSQSSQDLVEIIRFPVASGRTDRTVRTDSTDRAERAGEILSQDLAGTWARLKISSEYVDGKARVRIEKV